MPSPLHLCTLLTVACALRVAQVSYHIEHHIMPKMPDENLPRITDDIKRLASRHGLPFRTRPIEALAWEYVADLASVPRDRWGGAGIAVPILLPVAAAVLWWAYMGAVREADGRVHALDGEKAMLEEERVLVRLKAV